MRRSTLTRDALLSSSPFILGALCGGLTGLVDGVAFGSDAAQFVAGWSGQVRLVAYLSALYGFAGCIVYGALYYGLLVWTRYTRASTLLSFMWGAHHSARQRDPGDATIGLSFALAGLPIAAANAWITYAALLQTLSTRKHFGLVLAIAMLATLAALGASVVLTLLAARPLESLLRKLCRTGRLADPLSSPWAPLVVLGAFGALGVGLTICMAWETLRLLPLRPYIFMGVFAAIGVPLTWLWNKRFRLPSFIPAAGVDSSARAPAAKLGHALPLALCLSLILSALWLGGASDIQKASHAFSAWGSPFGHFIHTLSDWDRDGFSRLLAGGDCDDSDALIFPGAKEIPGDGVDNNCVGGDYPATNEPPWDQGFVPQQRSADSPYNILLVTIDTLRADHVGAYGYSKPTTPHLDALAQKGTLFENAWAHAPSTRYSIPAILTGRYPLSVKYEDIPGQWPGLSLDNLTLAEVAKSQGLRTGAVLNYWYFDRQRNMNQGFDYYDNQNKRLHRPVGREGPAKTSGSSSKEQSDLAIKFIAEHTTSKADQPFLLWVHYYDPHFDYEEHAGVKNFGDTDQDRYDHEIAYTDLHVGRVLDELKERGLDENTIVLVTGDHGEGFGEHGVNLHGYHLYAAQTKVPLIIHVPNQTPRRVRTPAGHVDIMPTLANLIGAKANPSMMGHSLLNLIEDPDLELPERRVFQQLSYENNHEKRGALSADCHVLYDVSPKNSWEIYNLRSDPSERYDIVRAPGVCQEVRDDLEAWVDQTDRVRGAKGALISEKPAVKDEDTVTFGQSTRLLSVTLPDQAKRGERAALTYTWEALRTPPPGYRIFVHLEHGARGRFIDDHDAARPLALWKKGEIIRYTRQVQIPATTPPGDYTVWVGVFKNQDRLDAKSVNVRIDESRADLGTLVVR